MKVGVEKWVWLKKLVENCSKTGRKTVSPFKRGAYNTGLFPDFLLLSVGLVPHLNLKLNQLKDPPLG